jgi:hypothetical protein
LTNLSVEVDPACVVSMEIGIFKEMEVLRVFLLRLHFGDSVDKVLVSYLRMSLAESNHAWDLWLAVARSQAQERGYVPASTQTALSIAPPVCGSA